MKDPGLLLPLLVLAVIASAIGVVYSKHLSRKQFVELQRLESDRDEMNIEWGQLQLEQSTVATHGRIEELARLHLKMTMPDPNVVVIVQP